MDYFPDKSYFTEKAPKKDGDPHALLPLCWVYWSVCGTNASSGLTRPIINS